HDVRVTWQEQIFVEGAILLVYDGKRSAWSICRGNRRENNDRQLLIIRRRLGGIERLTAADANDDVGSCLTGQLAVAVDFFLRAFIVEFFKYSFIAALLDGFPGLLPSALQNELIANDIGAVAKELHVFIKARKKSFSGNVFLRGGNRFNVALHAGLISFG